MERDCAMDNSILSLALSGAPLVTLLGGLILCVDGMRLERKWHVAQATLATALLASVGGAALAPFYEHLVQSTMMILVTTLAWIIARFSKTYLSGLDGQPRFLMALMFTVASVELVVASNHLALLAAAWLLSSVFLHRLLTFFGDRPAALMAARKKFLASRLAEIFLVGALILLNASLGTLNIDEIQARLLGLSEVPPEVHCAGLLLSLAVIVKSAQLPLHGWLLQVMEAPTPVSALLHAGVVNLGGFVLIRLAALISAVPMAQGALVIMGSATAVLASLVMTTRVSIKVKLAWSTCAQMGFMLVECGLGLVPLAFLHLIGHSLYKAHAFLSCNAIVRQTRVASMAPGAKVISLRRQAGAALIVLTAAVAASGVVSPAMNGFHVPWGFAVLFGLAALPLYFQWASLARTERALSLGVTLLLLCFALWVDQFLAEAISRPTPDGPVRTFLFAWAGVSFATLFLLQARLESAPDGRVARKAHAWVYGGFFLDEMFTRFTHFAWRTPALVVSPKKSSAFDERNTAWTGDTP